MCGCADVSGRLSCSPQTSGPADSVRRVCRPPRRAQDFRALLCPRDLCCLLKRWRSHCSICSRKGARVHSSGGSPGCHGEGIGGWRRGDRSYRCQKVAESWERERKRELGEEVVAVEVCPSKATLTFGAPTSAGNSSLPGEAPEQPRGMRRSASEFGLCSRAATCVSRTPALCLVLPAVQTGVPALPTSSGSSGRRMQRGPHKALGKPPASC